MTRAAGRMATAALVTSFLASACSPPTPPGPAANSAPVTVSAGPGAVARGGDLTTRADRARLAALTAERTAGAADSGYRIGVDDLLDIRIPDLVDAQPLSAGARLGATQGGMPGTVGSAPVYQQGVRVSGRGDVSLPMLGLVHVDGQTPTELEQTLATKLKSAGLLRNPQVSVQIAEYRSRVVAVIGSVERPGLYPITRPGATIADLVWVAGGPSKDAGRLVEFAPALHGDDAARAALAMRTASTAGGVQPMLGGPTAPPSGTAGTTYPGVPIRLDLDLLTHATGADARDLNPPVRPGDVINVAAAGSVLIHGWVEKPGSYPVSRGLTVTGALAAAGGHSFPADRSKITVKRVMGAGEEQTFGIDLVAVAAGQAADIPLTDGDVILVPASNSRLIPYGAWSAVRELVHIGGSVPLF